MQHFRRVTPASSATVIGHEGVLAPSINRSGFSRSGLFGSSMALSPCKIRRPSVDRRRTYCYVRLGDSFRSLVFNTLRTSDKFDKVKFFVKGIAKLPFKNKTLNGNRLFLRLSWLSWFAFHSTVSRGETLIENTYIEQFGAARFSYANCVFFIQSQTSAYV